MSVFSQSQYRSKPRTRKRKEQEERDAERIERATTSLLSNALYSTSALIPGMLKNPVIRGLRLADQYSRNTFNIMYNTGRTLKGIYNYSKHKFNNAKYRYNEAYDTMRGKMKGKYNHVWDSEWYQVYKEVELLESEITEFLKHESLDIDIDTLSNYIRNKPITWDGVSAQPMPAYPGVNYDATQPLYITDIIDRLFKYWIYSMNLDHLNKPIDMEEIDGDILLDINKHKIGGDSLPDYTERDLLEACDDLFEPDGKNYWYEYQLFNMIIDKDDDAMIDFTVSHCINREELEEYLHYKKFKWAEYTNTPWDQPVPGIPRLLPEKAKRYTYYETSSDSDSPNSYRSSPVGEHDDGERKNNDIEDDIFRTIHDSEYRRRQRELQNPGHLEISDDMEVDFMEQGLGMGRKKHTTNKKRKRKIGTKKHPTNKKRKRHHKQTHHKQKHHKQKKKIKRGTKKK